MMNIIKYPNNILNNRSNNTDMATISNKLDEMFDIMLKNNGVGLAACQIGLNLNVFIMNVDGKRNNDKIFINPSLLTYGQSELSLEGCLSFPSIYGKILRKTLVDITYTYNNEIIKETYDDLEAKIIQHEYDHLLGLTFIDKMSPADISTNKKKLKSLILSQQP